MTRSLYASKPKRQTPEARLQCAVVQHLWFRRKRGVLYFSIPNEGRRSEATGAKLKRMGLRPGAADLCVIVDGLAYFMEFKAARGTQSPEQVSFAADCVAAKAGYSMVNNIDAALITLRGWGAIAPEARAA